MQCIKSITESQCSLSVQDEKILSEVSKRLQILKQKKGKTNQQILQECATIIELLTKFFR
jgi:hypothetical protein